MFSYSELSPHAQKKHRPISSTVGIDTPTSPYFQTPTFDLILRLEGIQKRMWEVEQKQARHRKGKEGHKIKREKGALRDEQALLTQVLAIRTATPKEEKKTNPIVHCEPRRKTLVDYLPTSLLRPLSMAGFALALLTPGIALAEGGPTPEPTHPVPLSGHTLYIGRKGDTVSWWIKNDPKSPPIDVGKVQVAIADTYGPMNNPPGCADDIVKTNVSNVETEAAARARLKISSSGTLYSSARLITIPEARMVVDLINACALKAKQVISTVLPSITPLPPSKIPPTTSPTKTQSSPTPVHPTSTSTPQVEALSSTDSEQNIKYILGGAFVIALLGLGSLAALMIHNSKSEEKNEGPRPATLRSLPNTIDENDPRVIQLSGQGQPFKAYVGEGKPDIAATFEPRVMVIDADDPNLLQRVLNTLASAIKREDPSIVRAKATALMHHEGGHASNTSVGVAIIGIVRNQETKEIIGAAVRDPNFRATAEEQEKMFLGPDDPSAHDARNADLVKKEKQKKKNN